MGKMKLGAVGGKAMNTGIIGDGWGNAGIEHWVVVKGTAIVVNGEEEILLTENESTYIPLGTMHRLHNPGSIPLELIEVQSGSYLGEDDIVRVGDNYGRA